jgi:hypothetical protein
MLFHDPGAHLRVEGGQKVVKIGVFFIFQVHSLFLFGELEECFCHKSSSSRRRIHLSVAQKLTELEAAKIKIAFWAALAPSIVRAARNNVPL